MSKKNKYLEMLNLPIYASKDDIRKQFRKLAKEFHPDRNKAENATEIFQSIKEAYDYLIEDRPEINFIPIENSPSEEIKRMERIRKAKERLREQRLAEEKKIIESYQKLTSGLRWKVFSTISVISLFASFILLSEPYLPKHLEKQIVTDYSSSYNGLTQNQVFLIKTNQKLKIFCKHTLQEKLFYNDTIYIERSFVFHNPTKIFHRNKLEIDSYNIDFSVVNLFPFISILFSIPFFVQQKKQFTTSYIFLYKLSFYVIEGLFLIFLITQDRWLHFIFLGFI